MKFPLASSRLQWSCGLGRLICRLSWKVRRHITASSTAMVSTRCFSRWRWRSEEHTSELQSLMRNSYAVFCLKKKNINTKRNQTEVDIVYTYTTYCTIKSTQQISTH